MLKRLVFAVTTFFISASSVHAQTTPAQRLVIRSYNTIGVSLPMLDRAESTIGELLRQAGIDSNWRNCRTTKGPSSQSTDLCGDVVDASEVVVRLVRAPHAIADVEVLGYAHVDAYRGKGTLATVFVDRVRLLATVLRIDQGTLLGRAMAHEIGHLLLGTLDHAEQGLMRGHWSNGGRAGDWFFSLAQAERIRAAVGSRLNGVPPVLALARSTR